MKLTSTGIAFLDTQDADSLACPFHPSESLSYNQHGIQCNAERIPIKVGMDYIRLELTVDSLNTPQFKFENRPLLIGFVSKGWAKIQLHNQDIIKLEPGQCFLYSSEQLQIDRTSPSDVCIELIRCNRQFIQALLDFDMLPNQHAKQQLNAIHKDGNQLHNAAMQTEALQCSSQLTQSGHAQLRNRLGLEANALAWISAVFDQQGVASSTQTPGISLADREAIQKITALIDNDPCYEYSFEELCTFGGVNEHKLKTTFKLIHNKTVFNYLREKRMILAAELLQKDRDSVIEIANHVGYTNASHFARAFKNQHGLLPKAYQCLHRKTLGGA
ncbi:MULTISPECIES: AraC family transcriptional regulator [unclassified Lentimonas]|uniref:helix-turn-helix domain-containing protein n=1 Tax=unclassified Lentimonas TaxID=2630993 RepID=UPI00138A572C|nr:MULTISPECIES: AraC family transcriptional regulator [unclassified Lentimonas]